MTDFGNSNAKYGGYYILDCLEVMEIFDISSSLECAKTECASCDCDKLYTKGIWFILDQ